MDHDALTAATDRLVAGLMAAEHLLRSDLAGAVAAHDLDRAQLAGVEADARRQSRAGITVTADEFWTYRARPQASVLYTSCLRIQDEARDAIGDAVTRHGWAVAALDLDWDEAGRRWREFVMAEVHRLGPALIPPSTINSLGRWWQNRLRRRATVLALPGSLFKPAVRFPLLVTQRELELARRPPWIHGDRLLAAFELTHADLRARATDVEQDMVRRAAAVVETVLDRTRPAASGDRSIRSPRSSSPFASGNRSTARGRAVDAPSPLLELP